MLAEIDAAIKSAKALSQLAMAGAESARIVEIEKASAELDAALLRAQAAILRSGNPLGDD